MKVLYLCASFHLKNSKNMKKMRLYNGTLLLAVALLMITTSTACNLNKSDKQAAGQNDQQTTEQTINQNNAKQADMEALAKVMPKYNMVDSFHDGLALVCEKGTDRYGFIDKSGNEVIPCQYYDVSHAFSDGVAVVSKNGEEWSFIDKQGKEIASVDGQLQFYGGFQDGLMAFFKPSEEKEGYIDKSGKVVIPADLDMRMCNGPQSTDFSEGLCKRYDYDSQTSTFIDKTGKKVFECEGDAEDFSEGLAAVVRCFSKDNDDFVCRYGFVDKTGSEAIPFHFKHVGRFIDGLCWAETENSCGFINRNGGFELTGDYQTLVLDEEIECGEHPLCPTFSEGLAWVCNKDSKFGYIDKTGHVVIPFRYEAGYDEDSELYYQQPCYDFHDGLARIWDRTTEKYGYIDREGKEVFPCQFEYAEDMSEGLAIVERDGQLGFIDDKGHCTLDLGK